MDDVKQYAAGEFLCIDELVRGLNELQEKAPEWSVYLIIPATGPGGCMKVILHTTRPLGQPKRVLPTTWGAQ